MQIIFIMVGSHGDVLGYHPGSGPSVISPASVMMMIVVFYAWNKHVSLAVFEWSFSRSRWLAANKPRLRLARLIH